MSNYFDDTAVNSAKHKNQFCVHFLIFFVNSILYFVFTASTATLLHEISLLLYPYETVVSLVKTDSGRCREAEFPRARMFNFKTVVHSQSVTNFYEIQHMVLSNSSIHFTETVDLPINNISLILIWVLEEKCSNGENGGLVIPRFEIN